jgi:hypothetical protein
MILPHDVAQAGSALVQIHMGDLVAKNDGKLILVLHQNQDTSSHHDLAARVTYGSPIAGMRIEVNRVMQLAFAVLRHLVAPLLQLNFDGPGFRHLREHLLFLEHEEQLISCVNLVFGGEHR